MDLQQRCSPNAFQYISCYSLSYQADQRSDSQLLVSIHLMLLFIFNLFPDISICYRFNTSHVTLYPGTLCTLFRQEQCFNTSHVTLYHFWNKYYKKNGMFQYISCYSLSTSVSFIAAIGDCFNTSHVTLYHRRRLCCIDLIKFQYISCYSLSTW